MRPVIELAKLIVFAQFIALVLGQSCTSDGMYANVTAGCAKFYVCIYTGTTYAQVYSFSCPSLTLFDIRYKVCNWAYNVNCTTAS